MNSVYRVNKGINKSIEFKGLKAQYIWYFAGGIMGLMILFSLMYIAGVNTYVGLAIILSGGGALTYKVYQLSGKYGEFGMMKAAARLRVPKVLRCNSRRVFMLAGMSRKASVKEINIKGNDRL
ncbi:hypothetical protein ABIE26_002953 [Pedobacter africanus]|uniref:DUF4133 domain-containing protein n=1 Tax=Pedobacter africanus TaxID=151894 RepID=UPI003395CAF2